MASKSGGVWGIDLGRCALKAMRCHREGDQVVADGFDYIEYPKLLSQPDADAPQLVREALEQFLSRNSLRGDKVVVSVSGESGLARYFKPPPVDAKKIPDIVKYEARQQIPFAIEDVIWDYQRLAGGQEVEGFVMDSEIGLFAMKREQVTKALQPFRDAEIEVDIIQLAPIAIYNYVAYDICQPLPEGEDYNSEAPPPSVVVLAIGTDTTDLVVTNGYRLWQRNIPLGGSHFTKQLSKDLKLTFAKAEHLKRNPKQADDPKQIFQAMRPVFGDLVTEVQRSVGFFHSLDRKAKISSAVMLGNTVKLPGLAPYLSKHLGYEVKEVSSFEKLSGPAVVAAPAFKENLLAFPNCYGLCLQGLGDGKLSTNLLPREIKVERMVRAKKPWAVGAVSSLMLGAIVSFMLYCNQYQQVHEKHTQGGVSWTDAWGDADGVNKVSATLLKNDKEMLDILARMRDIGKEVRATADRRRLWPELLMAINHALPLTDPTKPGDTPDPKRVPFSKRKELHIEYVETEYFPDLEVWWKLPEVKTRYLDNYPELAKAAAPAAAPTGDDEDSGGKITATAINVPGPKGPGWVVELAGYHLFNDSTNPREGGAAHVRNTLVNNLKTQVLSLPVEGKLIDFTMPELGIDYIIIGYDTRPAPYTVPNPNAVIKDKKRGDSAAKKDKEKESDKSKDEDAREEPAVYTATRCDFSVQFVWIEKPTSIRLIEREEKRKKVEEEAKKQQAAAAAAAAAATGKPAAAPGAAPANPPPAAKPPAAAPAPAAPAPAAPAPAAPAAANNE